MKINLSSHNTGVDDNNISFFTDWITNSTVSDPYDYEYHELSYRIVGTLLMSIIFAVGFIGNVMVVLVVFRSKNMKSPTNCYLVSLAIADLILLLSATLPTITEFHLIIDEFSAGSVACSTMVFFQYLGFNLSSLSITALTAERYVAICKPMRAQFLCTVGRAKKIIAALWLFGTFYSAPWLGLSHSKRKKNSHLEECTFRLERKYYMAYYLTDLVVMYFIPVAVNITLYALISVSLYRSNSLSAAFSQSSASVHCDVETKKNLCGGKIFGKRFSRAIFCGNKCEMKFRFGSQDQLQTNLNGLKNMGNSKKLFSDLEYWDKNKMLEPRNLKKLNLYYSSDRNLSVKQNGLKSGSSFDLADKVARQRSLCNLNQSVTNLEQKITRNVSNNCTNFRHLQFYKFSDKTRKSYKSHKNENKNVSKNAPVKIVIKNENGDNIPFNSSQFFGHNKRESYIFSNPIYLNRTRSTSSIDINKLNYGPTILSRVQIIKMLVIVVCLFAILWLPYRVYVVYNSLISERFEDIWLMLVCRTMVHANSAINPILYNVMSAKFRRAFKKLCFCCGRK